MESKYVIQLIGVLLSTVSTFILGIYAIFEGHRGRRPGERHTTTYVPINLLTTILVLVILAGAGILIASQFQACAFLNYWVPDLFKQVRSFIRCR